MPGTVNNLPMGEHGVLIQPFTSYPGTRTATAGEAWRQIRNWWIVPYGGALLVIVVLAIALFYWRRGRSAAREPTPVALHRALHATSSAPRTGSTRSRSASSPSPAW